MQRVEIRISTEGAVTIKAAGVAGAGCQSLTEPFERALGAVVSDEPTDEMYQETVAENSLGA